VTGLKLLFPVTQGRGFNYRIRKLLKSSEKTSQSVYRINHTPCSCFTWPSPGVYE
jgi:hypothetical protein